MERIQKKIKRIHEIMGILETMQPDCEALFISNHIYIAELCCITCI